MPNMSYCRFHNTYLDFSDCMNVVGEALDNGLTMAEFLAELSEDEQYYFKRLAGQAVNFVQYYEELLEAQHQEEY